MSNCPRCNNTGQIPGEIYYLFCGLVEKNFCTCQYGKILWKAWIKSKKVQNAIREKRQKEVEKFLKFSQIPKQEKSLETLIGQENLKQVINQYIKNFPQKQGLYLWSVGSGCGKTHILCALCQEVINRYVTPCIFMTEEQVYQKIRESFDNPDIFEKDRFDRFKSIRCLFIDDLGATKPTLWKTEALTALLDHRLNNNLPTFFTSNYSLPQYESFLKQVTSRPARIPSRIYEMCQIIEVKGEDRRKHCFRRHCLRER